MEGRPVSRRRNPTKADYRGQVVVLCTDGGNHDGWEVLRVIDSRAAIRIQDRESEWSPTVVAFDEASGPRPYGKDGAEGTRRTRQVPEQVGQGARINSVCKRCRKPLVFNDATLTALGRLAVQENRVLSVDYMRLLR